MTLQRIREVDHIKEFTLHIQESAKIHPLLLFGTYMFNCYKITQHTYLLAYLFFHLA